LVVGTTGAWFGGVHDSRVVISLVAFQCVSLAWLWLAARVRTNPQAGVAAA